MVRSVADRAFLPAKSMFEQVGNMMILTGKTITAVVRPPYPYGGEFISQFLFALRKNVIGGGESAYEEAFRLKASDKARALLEPIHAGQQEEIRLRAAMMAAVDEAVGAAGGRELVVVSHQTPVMVARSALNKRRGPPWIGGVACTTGSVTTLEIEDGVVKAASYFEPRVS